MNWVTVFAYQPVNHLCGRPILSGNVDAHLAAVAEVFSILPWRKDDLPRWDQLNRQFHHFSSTRILSPLTRKVPVFSRVQKFNSFFWRVLKWSHFIAFLLFDDKKKNPTKKCDRNICSSPVKPETVHLAAAPERASERAEAAESRGWVLPAAEQSLSETCFPSLRMLPLWLLRDHGEDVELAQLQMSVTGRGYVFCLPSWQC